MSVLDLYLPHDELQQRVVRGNVYSTFEEPYAWYWKKTQASSSGLSNPRNEGRQMARSLRVTTTGSSELAGTRTARLAAGSQEKVHANGQDVQTEVIVYYDGRVQKMAAALGRVLGWRTTSPIQRDRQNNRHHSKRKDQLTVASELRGMDRSRARPASPCCHISERSNLKVSGKTSAPAIPRIQLQPFSEEVYRVRPLVV
jgi:hypothetical protein